MSSLRNGGGPSALDIVFVLTAGGLILSIVVGILVPVYTDETGWRFLQRAGIDGVDGLFSDICGPTSIAVPPIHIWPVRLFSAAANGAFPEPIFVRLAGVACALAWLALVWLLLRRVEGDSVRRKLLGILAFAILGIGTLPFAMVLSRPEQPIILTTLLIVLVALWDPTNRAEPRLIWIKVATILMLSIVAQSYHMKGVLYGAVALVAMWACGQGRTTLVPRFMGMLALVTTMAASAHYWSSRMSCPGDAKLAGMFAQENVASALAAGAGVSDFARVLANGIDPFGYVMLILPRADPMSNWLPPDQFTIMQSLIVYWLLWAAWSFALAAMAYFTILFVWKSRFAALQEPRLLLATALIGACAVWAISQLNRNDYEAGHILPSLVVALLLILTLPGGSRRRDTRVLRVSAAALFAAALASQVIVFSNTLPTLWTSAQTPGYAPQQPFSVSIADYTPIREAVTMAMDSAGIQAGVTYKRLLVDELTYPALSHHHRPIHQLGVLRVWNGSVTDPIAYLVSRNSDGVVTACRTLDGRLLAAASRAEGICAISATTLRELNVRASTMDNPSQLERLPVSQTNLRTRSPLPLSPH
ncbi:hypothetical protein [Qipengyuania qiaonensis]|uniref:Glycosyltransferase RgtA/B/C/D-like domain-containing protein n=1 Tax=Qipengyuania qiaonensis TaxID=2867240 RepID=A0ABS7J343_9SPHN|nr:hypothetical protein [Qipengyuania qiaonensis]MBX7481750.1 hypothetical protein [Qipengyuania qiaonensis]